MLPLIITYICGSIPFGLILSNIFGNGDLREKGSKNIGATNVVRTQGKTLGAIVFLLDFLKGFAPVAIFSCYTDVPASYLASAAVLGHIFPIWLKFKGGKGVATYIGVLFAVNYQVALFTLLTWIVIFKISKTSAIASLSCTAVSLLFLYLCEKISNLDLILYTILVAIIFLRHSSNIKKLIER